MALELLSHMFFFRLRHLPEHQLQLRIGIHTGILEKKIIYKSFGTPIKQTWKMLLLPLSCIAQFI